MKGPSYVVSCTWNSFPTKYVPLLVSNEDVNKQTTTHNSLTNNQASRLLSTNDLYLQELCKYWLRLFSHLNVCLRPHEVADKLAVNIHQLTLRELENGKGRGGGGCDDTAKTNKLNVSRQSWFGEMMTLLLHLQYSRRCPQSSSPRPSSWHAEWVSGGDVRGWSISLGSGKRSPSPSLNPPKRQPPVSSEARSTPGITTCVGGVSYRALMEVPSTSGHHVPSTLMPSSQ